MTKTKNNTPDLSRSVMQEIKSGHVKMRPKLYFIAGSLLLGLGLAAAMFSSLFFIAVASHNLRIYAPHQYLWFGGLGIFPFLHMVPWVPLFISIFSIYGGTRLLKRYDISYKKSFAGIVVGLITSIIILGLFIDRFGINAQLQKIKPLQGLYLKDFIDQDFATGKVQGISQQTLELVSPEGYTYTLNWDEDTLLPKGASFQLGDTLRAVGEWQGATFSATGIMPGHIPTPAALQDPNVRKELHRRMMRRIELSR